MEHAELSFWWCSNFGLIIRVATRKRLRKSSIFHEIRKPNLGFWIFGSFKMLARFSTYDFWNLEIILSLYRKKISQKIFFEKIGENREQKPKTYFFGFFFQTRNAKS